MNSTINPDELPEVALADSKLCDELRTVADMLLKEGYGVFYAPDMRLKMTWMIIERSGNVGTIEWATVPTGYRVSFMTKPSRQYGSGLLITEESNKDGRIGFDMREPAWQAVLSGVMAAAALATQDRYKNSIVPVVMPNHGWAHFEWARSILQRITRHGDGSCKHCGRPGGHGPGDDD